MISGTGCSSANAERMRLMRTGTSPNWLADQTSEPQFGPTGWLAVASGA